MGGQASRALLVTHIAPPSLQVMPLFHVHGLMAGLLAPLAAGAAVILPAAGRFSAGTFWKDAVRPGWVTCCCQA